MSMLYYLVLLRTYKRKFFQRETQTANGIVRILFLLKIEETKHEFY